MYILRRFIGDSSKKVELVFAQRKQRLRVRLVVKPDLSDHTTAMDILSWWMSETVPAFRLCDVTCLRELRHRESGSYSLF